MAALSPEFLNVSRWLLYQRLGKIRSTVPKVIYSRRLQARLGFFQSDPTVIFEDNATFIKWADVAVGGGDGAKLIDLHENFFHEA